MTRWTDEQLSGAMNAEFLSREDRVDNAREYAAQCVAEAVAAKDAEIGELQDRVRRFTALDEDCDESLAHLYRQTAATECIAAALERIAATLAMSPGARDAESAP